MSKSDAAGTMAERLYHHLTAVDNLPPTVQMELELGPTASESDIVDIPLPKLASAILDEIDSSEWEKVAYAIQNKTSSNDPMQIYCATADYFLIKNHGQLDLTYFLLQKFGAMRTIRPIETDWIDPHPLLYSSGIIDKSNE